MKKNLDPRKKLALKLHRETLLCLEKPELRFAMGGFVTDVATGCGGTCPSRKTCYC